MANNTTAYIKTDNGIIQLIDGTSCSLNFGIADIRDLASRGGTFSKQLNAVWSDDNHRILGQLFDINATNFDFNFNLRVPCEVIQNGLVIVSDAYLQLIEINESQKTSAQQSNGSYSILVKSAQRDLFTKMGAKELTELDFTNLNHLYDVQTVVNSFTNDVTDGYVYPMCINDTNNFLLTDFRPSIYVKNYFDQIHATNGFSYEVRDWDIFDKLIIPFSNDKPLVDNTNFIVEATKSSFESGGGALTGWTEIIDNESLFNPTLGEYDVPVYLTGGQAINTNVAIDFDLILDNSSGADAYLVDITNSGFDRSVKYQGYFRIKKNGVPSMSGQFVVPSFYGFEFFESDSPIVNGDTTIFSSSYTLNIAVGNVLPTDVLTFEIDAQVASGNALPFAMKWKDAPLSTANDVTVTPRIDVNDVTVRLELTANTIGFGFEQNMNNYIPPKIKQKDFVKSICNMAQLMAYPDADNSNKIIYQPRDSYLDSGEEKDWRRKLAKNENQLVKFLPELSGKRKIFTYKEDKDVYNTSYKEATNQIYGQAEFVFETEFKQNTDTLTLIFSPTPMAEISIGAIVPTFIGGAPNVNIRILIHNGTAPCNPYNIFNFGTTGTYGFTYYPMVSHFDNHYNPTIDINFAVCDYYFYQGINLTNNNLFNLNWRRTMAQMNSGKMLTAMFDLSVADIADLKLNDKIYTKDSWWNINRVIDYNANGNKNTKVELLSIDDELELPNVYIPQGVPPKDLGGADNPIGGLLEDIYVINNINYSSGSAKVSGVGNVIGQNVSGFIVGNDQIIEESGYWVNGKNIGDGSDFYKAIDYFSINIDSDITVDPTAQSVIYLTASGLTITLPDADLYTDKKVYIKDKNFGGQTITASVGSIDTRTSVSLRALETLTLHAKGGIWNIL